MFIKRTSIVFICFILCFTVLVFTIYYSMYGGIANEVKAVSGTRQSSINLYNSKGIIYDRDLCALAGNQFSYYLLINPRSFDKSKTEYIAEITNNDLSYINSRLNKETPFVLSSYTLSDTVKGVFVFEGTTRYLENPVSVHLLGYLDSDNVNGLSGVEKSFNNILSQYAQSVSVNYSRDAASGLLEGLGITVSRSGEDSLDGVILTLDKEICTAVERIMEKYIERGCVTVMDCNTGEILAMSSYPDFKQGNIKNYIDSDNGELINLALTNQTVGSVFKMVMATCALQNGLDEFEYNCTGGIVVGDRTFSCQNNHKHGKLNLKEAFAQSCNSYFIALGQLLGYDKIVETSQLFGVDCSCDLIRNINSDAGKIPEGNGILTVANLSIGQGELMISPLSISRITAAMCNGGFLVNPTLYNGTYINGQIGNKSEYSYKNNILSTETAEKLKEMCIYCVSDGTGSSAKPEIGGAGGKTASAQTGKYDQNGKEILNTYFTGFYPSNSPKYVITVFVENGVSGSQSCAPVFKEICDFLEQNH